MALKRDAITQRRHCLRNGESSSTVNILENQKNLLACLMAGLLLLVGGCTKARVGDDDASVAPNPLDETFLCHVFSNELLQKEIDFYTEYYAYYSSEPYSSSE